MLNLTFYLLAIPVSAMILIGIIPSRNQPAVRAVAWIALSLVLALAVILLFRFDRSIGGYQFITQLAWTETPRIQLHLGVDGISLWLVLLTAIVGFAGLFATASIREGVKGFFLLYLVLVAGALGTFLSLDILFFFFFYEIEALVAYPVISVWGRGERKYSAMQFTIFSVLGSAFVLIGILALYFTSGANTTSIPELTSFLKTSPLPPALEHRIFAMFLIGFGMLAALWPFHAWGPVGYQAAPTAGSMVFAGIVKKLGAYGLIRIGLSMLPHAAQAWMPWVAGLAIMNLIYVGFVALAQKDLRSLIGYSSSSHMGFVLIGLACFTPVGLSGALLVMFAHGILVALLFLLAETIERETQKTNIAEMKLGFGGLGAKWPFTAASFSLAGLAAAGVPGFANFAGELVILFAAWDRYGWLAAGVLVSVILTALYMLRAIRNIFFGPIRETVPIASEPVQKPAGRIPYVLLIGSLLILGFFPSVALNDFKQGIVGAGSPRPTGAETAPLQNSP